ncbi:MAG: 4-hydroxythreonine-4-phosphate dehydrogenase PdxA [Cyclobacteriaceae bacterium]|nr:4-hydroxythreonine-4-phosphate dehydrogenase PdxA [Cyclobacteriaceae bacterium]
MQHQKPRIGITLGDLNGIGPEVVIKALHDTRIISLITPVIYGSTRVLSFYKKQLNLEEFNYGHTKSRGQFIPKTINVVNCWEDVIEIIPGKPSKPSGYAAWLALKQATLDLKEGLIDALVTAPIDKNTIHSEEFPYTGHTEFLADYFGVKDHLMLMISESLRVGLVTEHVAVKDIAANITAEHIDSKLKIFEQTLRKDFGINKPRIAVLGLNPHAGDGGLIGSEDEKIIKPVIQDWKNKGKLLFGPFPADGFFATGSHSKFDGVLAMYHDQGLVPFKLLAFESGVNYSAGLPVIRTSPDHGTAYSIAGKNLANEGSIRQAIYSALDIVNARQGVLQEIKS